MIFLRKPLYSGQGGTAKLPTLLYLPTLCSGLGVTLLLANVPLPLSRMLPVSCLGLSAAVLALLHARDSSLSVCALFQALATCQILREVGVVSTVIPSVLSRVHTLIFVPCSVNSNQTL